MMQIQQELITMKKICIGLLIILLMACAYLFNFSKKIDAVKETEQQLVTEKEDLVSQVKTLQESITAKETEIAQLTDEKKPVMEESEVWQQRTEEIQALLQN
jgi:peptidoglycan hydrolase CwlO-like protein